MRRILLTCLLALFLVVVALSTGDGSGDNTPDAEIEVVAEDGGE